VHKTGTGPKVEETKPGAAGAGQKAEETGRRPARAKPGTTTRAVVEVGFHSLRHTFVSLCRESNAPLAVVESIVGHSNPAMTRHYTHVGELAAGQAVAALPWVMGGDKPAVTGNEPEAALGKVRVLLQTMGAGSWEEKRAEALALLTKMVYAPADRQN
jgi:Phage integrase family